MKQETSTIRIPYKSGQAVGSESQLDKFLRSRLDLRMKSYFPEFLDRLSRKGDSVEHEVLEGETELGRNHRIGHHEVLVDSIVRH